MHGFIDATVADAPTFDQVLPELLRGTDRRTVPAHNGQPPVGDRTGTIRTKVVAAHR